jgi:SAM-dependent methyltransferase
MKNKKHLTSWENASDWYHEIVGSEGHYYHQHVIFPLIRKLLITKKKNQSILDLGCGQGVLSQHIPDNYTYDGVDISSTFIKLARKHFQIAVDKTFHLHDLCQPFELGKAFTHAILMLSFQNLEKPSIALDNAKKHLKQGGTLIMVLNHPCFRIPRQSCWGVDEEKKIQYRRMDSYLSFQKIPIDIHPGQKDKTTTFSFHHSLTDIFGMLEKSGFTVSSIIESTSDKTSTGKNAKMENKARSEFPLFMTIIAKSL